ncbi:hypothetical protein JCM15519_32740 [Fundidesulfovibrio butyratiphilus]
MRRLIVEQYALFAFRGEVVCFVHVMLNAIDLREKGFEVAIVLEGESTKVLAELSKPEHPMHKLFERTKSLGLITGVCKACAYMMGTQDAVAREGLPMADDMHGHAGMAPYLAKGYTIITF